MKKKYGLILIVCVFLLALSACTTQSAKYKAYKNDVVVASVNGINIYLSEIEVNLIQNNDLIDGLYALVDEGKYDVADIESNYAYKTKEEVLDELITFEAVAQYALSNGYEAMSIKEKQKELEETQKGDEDLYKENENAITALIVSVNNSVYEKLSMSKDSYIKYYTPIAIRNGLYMDYRSGAMTDYENKNGKIESKESIDAFLTEFARITDEIVKSAKVEKFGFPEN